MSRASIRLEVLVVLLVCASPSYAVDLAAPFAIETTQVLPAHIRNPRFIDVNTSMDQIWDGTGQSQALGYQLNKPISFSQMIVTQSPAKQGEIQGLMASQGLNLGESPGSTTGQVNTYANIFVPVLAWGITDRFTLAVAVPIVHVDVSVASGFNMNSTGGQLVGAAAQATNPAAAQDAANQMNTAINQKAAWAGMNPLQSFAVNGIGDVQVVGKYQVYDDHFNAVSVKGTLSLPTGTGPNPNQVVDVPTGDGAWGMGATLIHDMKLPFDLRWNNYGSYLAYVPHSLTKRIPQEADDPISPDTENLTEDVQNLFQFGTGIERQFVGTGLSVGGGYSLQYLSGATYDPGSLYGAQQYSWLNGLQPSETLHSLLADIQFSTVEMYQAKKFFYPFQARLAYSKPFAGRNATTNDLVTGELVLFF